MEPNQQRAAVWAAVSSRPQTIGDSLERQLVDGRQYAEKQGWLVVAELVVPGETREYVELSDARQGLAQELRSGERNAYDDLVDLLDRRAIDVLICRGRDRLGRTDSLVAVIEERARRAGCMVQSLTMPGTGHTDSDLFLAAFERVGAQRELVELRRRIHYGMNARARKGKPVASVLPFGYKPAHVEGERVAVVDATEAEAYRWAVRATLEGQTQVSIREELNRQFPHRFKTDTSVRYVLRNPFHVGIITRRSKDPRGTVVTVEAKGNHEALIDRETWTELQAYLDMRAMRRRPPKTSLWSGILYCDYCGKVMYFSNNKSGWATMQGVAYYGYHCSTHVKSRGCRWNYISLDRVTASLVKHLQKVFLKYENEIEQTAAARTKNTKTQRAKLEAQIVSLEKARKKLVYLFTSDRLTIEDYDNDNEDLRTRAKSVQDQLDELTRIDEAKERQTESASLVRELLPNLEQSLAGSDAPTANRWLRQIFRAVYVKDGKVVRVEF